ncbi:MAG TPA: 2Fe-2S iron-sulfur cluster-binding protein [Terriglobales bacterium]|nr:2Fe-2S iron-sulfur cluster-binding protein [Terriglobales bacterium]
MNDHVDGREFFTVTLVTPTGERDIRVASDEHIWDAAYAQGIKLPALCHQGWCLTCAAHMEGPGETDQSDSVAYFPEDRKAGFALLCTGKPRSDLRLRTHQAVEMRRHRLRSHLPAPYSTGLKP